MVALRDALLVRQHDNGVRSHCIKCMLGKYSAIRTIYVLQRWMAYIPGVHSDERYACITCMASLADLAISLIKFTFYDQLG